MWIDRHFLRLLDGRLVHYRAAGTSRPGELPLLLAHAGPGSSAGLAPLIGELAAQRRVIAPDMPGNGDSDPLPQSQPELSDYVDQLVQTLDRLGLDQVDYCGQHSGAHIGVELALRHPNRVRRLVLDGLGVFPPALQQQMLERYAPPMQPDEHGGHLAWAWQFVGEMFVHFPHFLRDPAHRLMLGPVPPAAARHALVVELLKALPTYHLAYRAVFSHATAERLPRLRLPTLLMAAEGDPMRDYLDAAAALLPASRAVLVPREARAAEVMAFLTA
ncbi:alpha/beta fold hydrolase [Roseateles cellulosilyticus]|uniref:Alpha/beta hydrolase n=1 Tax=Pelomonas cellulosilytica TaxID=2906762 RepID=A0ABS8XNJ0_9BURK|nr:alpha/beta hydrolase [Pelomonas sp. P8]MCE4552865.1 alpha/beta hydrolase [Pelomonas sp. P8]